MKRVRNFLLVFRDADTTVTRTVTGWHLTWQTVTQWLDTASDIDEVRVEVFDGSTKPDRLVAFFGRYPPNAYIRKSCGKNGSQAVEPKVDVKADKRQRTDQAHADGQLSQSEDPADDQHFPTDTRWCRNAIRLPRHPDAGMAVYLSLTYYDWKWVSGAALQVPFRMNFFERRLLPAADDDGGDVLSRLRTIHWRDNWHAKAAKRNGMW